MNTKHTPGPWKQSSTIPGDEYSAVVLGGQYNGIIAKAQIDVYTDADTAEANAKLIAAAPELLEALQGVIAFANKNLSVPDNYPHLRKALAAIKKATE